MAKLHFGLVVVLLTLGGARLEDDWDPVRDQLSDFRNRTGRPIGILTSSSGAPISFADASSSINSRLIHNEFVMDAFTHVVREVIPERVVHAKGAGAFGYFEVTKDISHISRAAFLSKVGKKTPVAIRFATSTRERGSSDFRREPRGFSVKFYTEEGNFDVPGFNTPIYFYKDPVHFVTFAHAIARNPATHVFDRNMLLDTVQLIPESMFLFLYVFSDRGLPASYRHMPGYGIHTYQVENNHGESSWIRLHLMPEAGIKNLTNVEAASLGADLDYMTKDLYREIAKGNFPCWTVGAQILTKSDVKREGVKIFDVTRVISLTDFPLYEFGRICLNRNAKNYFAEIEQLAFSPSNVVPGILGGVDKIYESRRLGYRDAQLYRLGGNFKNIPVNCPFQSKTFTYNRDGVPPVGSNEEDAPNYYPNSFNGPVPLKGRPSQGLINIMEKNGPDNFDQAAEFYAKEISSEERTRLVANLAAWVQSGTKDIQEKMLKLLTNIHPELGQRVTEGLNAL